MTTREREDCMREDCMICGRMVGQTMREYNIDPKFNMCVHCRVMHLEYNDLDMCTKMKLFSLLSRFASPFDLEELK